MDNKLFEDWLLGFTLMHNRQPTIQEAFRASREITIHQGIAEWFENKRLICENGMIFHIESDEKNGNS